MSTPPESTVAPDRKRRRAEDEEHEEKVFVPHPSLYLEDGNVVLSAGGHLFRVHRSVLAKHSPVLRDLFQRKHESLHGCPHIPLDHTSEELAALISVIYNGCGVDAQRVTAEAFLRLANILRLATRYRIEGVAAQVIACVRAEWPDDLAKRYTRQNIIAASPAATIALLRECGYADASLLFPLFYALSTTALRSGIPALAQQLALLAAEDTARLVAGIERLRAEHARLALPPNAAGLCCTPGIAQLWAQLSLAAATCSEDPVDLWAIVASRVGEPHMLAAFPICPRCVAATLSYLKGVPARLWAWLPAAFGLVDAV